MKPLCRLVGFMKSLCRLAGFMKPLCRLLFLVPHRALVKSSALYRESFGTQPHMTSGYTDLQTALDQVEGYDCRVCNPTAEDATEAAQGIVFHRAKLAANIRI